MATKRTYERGRDYGQPRQTIRGKKFVAGDRVRFRADRSLGTVIHAGAHTVDVQWDDGERGRVSPFEVIHTVNLKRKPRLPNARYRPPQEYHGEAYKGYFIGFNALRNEYWIEKDKHFISYAQTIPHAKKIIDELTAENPHGKTYHLAIFKGMKTEDVEKMHRSLVPGSKIHKAATIELRHRKKVSNPPKGAVKIYGRCLRIEAVKLVPHTYGGKPAKPGQKYFHDFTAKNAMIYGMPDGSLRIVSK